MKKNLFFAFLLSGLILFSSCSKKTLYYSDWQTKEYIVNGVDDNWSTKLHSNTANKLVYILSNDDENLYLSIRAYEQTSIQKMLMFGFTIWIDTSGKKKQTFGIKAPLGRKSKSSASNKNNKFQSSGGRNLQVQLKRILANPNKQMMLIGYRYESNVLLDQKNNLGIEIDYALDSFETLVYEAKIPFKVLYPEDDSFQLNYKTISICLESGAMSMPASGGPSGGMQGGGRSGGGSGGGKHGMTGQRADMTEMQALTEPIYIWLKRIALSSETE